MVVQSFRTVNTRILLFGCIYTDMDLTTVRLFTSVRVVHERHKRSGWDRCGWGYLHGLGIQEESLSTFTEDT